MANPLYLFSEGFGASWMVGLQNIGSGPYLLYKKIASQPDATVRITNISLSQTPTGVILATDDVRTCVCVLESPSQPNPTISVEPPPNLFVAGNPTFGITQDQLQGWSLRWFMTPAVKGESLSWPVDIRASDGHVLLVCTVRPTVQSGTGAGIVGVASFATLTVLGDYLKTKHPTNAAMPRYVGMRVDDGS